MAEEVKVVVTEAPATLINGVYVALHDNTTKALLQSDTTGNGALDDGEVIFSAVTPAVYEIRIVPPTGVAVSGGKVQTIDVLDAPTPPDSNIFDVTVTQSGLPVSPNSNMCRCSGYFVTLDGQPRADLSLHFSDSQVPQLEVVPTADYNVKAIVPSRLSIHTDDNGYVVVDLYRGVTYTAYLEGWENVYREITVPDLAAANLADVLFPYVASVTFKELGVPVTSLSLSVDEVSTIEYTTLLSNGNEALPSEVEITTDDESVAVISMGNGELTITGVSAGTTDVVITRTATEERTVPATTVTGTLTITVS